MKKVKKPNKMLTAALALLLIASSLLIAAASSASRRASVNEKSEEISSSADSRLPLESMLERLTESTEGTKEPSEETKVTDSESEEVALTIDELVFTPPVSGNVISPCSLTTPVFSLTMNDFRTHNGVDLEASLGESVLCCADGTVKSIENDPMMGMSVTVDHGNGIESVYRNLSDSLAEGIVEGCGVSGGTVLGAVGDSALVECEEVAHLHFELSVDGVGTDPAVYIGVKSVSEVFEDSEG